jgi:hypothetical protein
LLRGKVEVHTFVFCVGFLQQATEKLLLLPCVFVSGRQAGRQLVSLLGKPAHFGVCFFSLCVHLFHHSARVVVRVLTTFQPPTFYYLFKVFESGFSFLSKTHSLLLS